MHHIIRIWKTFYLYFIRILDTYCQTSNLSGTLVGNKIADHSDVVGASPVGSTPTKTSFLTLDFNGLNKDNWIQDVKHLSLGFGAPYIDGLAQDCSNSIANALELLQSCTKPLILEILQYRKVSNIRRTLGGNKIIDNSDVVGASPVGGVPTSSSFST